MEKSLNNKCKMVDAVAQVMTDNLSVWEDSTVMMEVNDKVKAKRAEIATEDGKAQASTAGTTVDKATLREEVEQQVFLVGSQLFAYGHKINNATLWNAVDFTTSNLSNARENDLVRIGYNTHKLALEYANPLLDYKINVADTNKLRADIDNFYAVTPAGRAKVSVREVSGEKVADLVAELMILLTKQLDKLMVVYKRSNPDFYAAYHNARLIVDYGIRHEKKEEATGTAAAK